MFILACLGDIGGFRPIAKRRNPQTTVTTAFRIDRGVFGDQVSREARQRLQNTNTQSYPPNISLYRVIPS
jgi:hypothetical protein